MIQATFLNYWQNLPAKIDPVLFEINGLQIRYYGLMYILAFALTYLLVLYRIRHEERFRISAGRMNDLMTVMIIGLLIGARLGYVIFYNLSFYIQNPLEIFLPFSFENGFRFTGISGMSFHGGLIGATAAAWLYTRKNRLGFLESADLFIPAIPLGYTFGRLGNFINGELYGRMTQAPIGMYFPNAPGEELRHPSQLYEAFFEGIVLFAILWAFRRRRMREGAMMSFYMIGYGAIRFLIEFFRQPDVHLGFVFLNLTMGQVLSISMVMGGLIIYLLLGQRRKRRE